MFISNSGTAYAAHFESAEEKTFNCPAPAENEKVAKLNIPAAGGFGGGGGPSSFKEVIEMIVSFFSRLLSRVPDTPDDNDHTPTVVPDPDRPMPRVVDDALPGLSDKRNGIKPENIWSGFRQGPDGNCVTVAAIKAAMYKFGQSPTDIFKDVQRVGDGYRVTMRDDYALTVTDAELAQGAQGARFVGSDEGMLKDAQFLYAVSAKRAQMENNDGRAARSYQAAIDSLNDGEDEYGAGEGLARLGLRKHMRTVNVKVLANGQLGMVNRRAHSVAVINGQEELWGRKGGAPTHGQAIALV